MFTNQLDFIEKNILPSLYEHGYSWPFHNPVDTVKYGLDVSFLFQLICIIL